jgi:serine protease Do
VNARVVGTAPDLDLALLKVDATGLRALPLADYNTVKQGQLVFAFGSPEGLRNSVSMGVVSAVVRQPDPDRPAVYLQTDAPINPGNSGGPLVNLAGELVGLNTFILTKSGGSQGLGFAIPSAVVASAYPQLRKYGHLHRGALGVGLQAVTPTLATALRLSKSSGVLVSDVMPDSGAERAGVHIGDIVTSVNGRLVDNVPMFSLELGLAEEGQPVTLGLLRGTTPLTLQVPVTFRRDPIEDLATLTVDPETHGVPVLGIVGLDVSDAPALRASLRIDTGVLVTARTLANADNLVPLNIGDVIHAVDGIPVRSLDGLRVLLDGHPANSDVVLQVERQGQLVFVACEIN